MFILKHSKTLQHVSIMIEIIFRELVYSSLKSLILKSVENVKINVVMWQHNIWCVCVRLVWRGMLASIPLHTGGTHRHQMLCCHITTLTFYIFNKF